MTQTSNRLGRESSAYLLQHAHNPVDWYPWSPEAFLRAEQEHKPVLVSIGYSACHWCHVMERESFEDPQIAAFMNEQFINIKVDRQERPDLDQIYLEAVQAISGSGGWPLNVFLTPERLPFYGGTYFPPNRANNLPSWMEVLEAVARTFREQSADTLRQAKDLVRQLEQANRYGLSPGAGSGFTASGAAAMAESLLRDSDRLEGGFGRAPKFPQTLALGYLLRYYHFSGNRESLDQVLLSLDHMLDGGIQDHVGGGFARYATDGSWKIPHFEKMLYDNALMVSLLAEAWQLTRREDYRRVIRKTLGFVARELTGPEGCFLAARDADSEGVEGKYDTWTAEETRQVLGPDASWFNPLFGISQAGNWEGRNILHRVRGLPNDPGDQALDPALEKLLNSRSGRIPPLLDEQVILGWNSLMVSALCRAGSALNEESWLELARRNLHFLEQNLCIGGTEFLHHWRPGSRNCPAFLDDYALLIEALILFQEASGESPYLVRAREVLDRVIADFWDPDQGFFYYTPVGHRDVLYRKKEVYDGALPSGNSVLSFDLNYLGLVFDHKPYRDLGERMLREITPTLLRYPLSFGVWAQGYLNQVAGTLELVLVGPQFRELSRQLGAHFLPWKVLQAAPFPLPGFPLLRGKGQTGRTLAYLCRNHVCLEPVSGIDALLEQIQFPATGSRGEDPAKK